MKIWMTYFDDGKEKWQSHEVSMGVRFEESDKENVDPYLFSSAYIDVEFANFPTGYGATKEDAIQNFKDKMKFIADSFNNIINEINNNPNIEIRNLNTDNS